jgi:hypothetical protein
MPDDDRVRVPSVRGMDDETLIKYMEYRHDEDLKVKNLGHEPDREAKGLAPRLRGSGQVWRTFHNKMHELYDGRMHDGETWFDHYHEPEAE